MTRGVGGEGGARGGRDPNAGGRSGPKGGGTGAGGSRGTLSQQQDRRNAAAARAAGNAAPGVRDGLRSVASIGLKDLNPQTPGFGALGPRGPVAGWGTSPDFTKAMAEYQNRSFFDKALDFLGGSYYDQNAPNPLDPRSYAGGINHTSTNVPGAIGSLIGTGIGGPAGLLAGQVLGYGGSLLPGGNVYHGGDPALAGYNTGTGVSGAAPGSQGGTGQGGQGWAQGGILAPPQPATPSIPGAANNGWGPPPQTPMPSLLAPQWPQPNPSSGLLSGQNNNNWSWGSWG